MVIVPEILKLVEAVESNGHPPAAQVVAAQFLPTPTRAKGSINYILVQRTPSRNTIIKI